MKKREYGLGKVVRLIKEASDTLDRVADRAGKKENLWKWRSYLNVRCQLTDLINNLTK